MWFTPALTLLPMPIQIAARQELANYNESIERLLDDQDKTDLVMGIVRDFKDLVKKPDGKLGWAISLSHHNSPQFTIYCCVKSFSDVAPIVKILAEAGYIIYPEATEDNKYSMSRTFTFKKGEYWQWDHIKIVAFALEKLGAECRAVSIGYERTSHVTPVERFKLVCDDLEEKALKSDINNPNYL